jgi:hypothetical protein
MFTPRDSNRLPAAPAVKIPTLGTSSGGMAVGSTYAPSLSLRRRFGPAPLPLEAREVARDAYQAPVAELNVHECDVPSGTVESPSPQDDVMEVAAKKRANEGDKVEDVTALVAFPHAGAEVTKSTTTPTTAAGSAPGSDEAPQAEFLLQKGEFLERLVQRVRASCSNVMGEGSENAAVTGKRVGGEVLRRSPPPRRPSPAPASSTAAVLVQWGSYDDDVVAAEDEVIVPRATALSRPRSRSRSPSLLSSPSLAQKAPVAELLQSNGSAVDARNTSPPKSPAALRSGATSPDPRVPSTDFFAAGGALRSSLQHSRCSGVSRGRRSVSAERSDPADNDFDVDALELKEGDAFWVRTVAAATTGQRASSLSRERLGVSATQHPQWVPHPIPQARPAWNQRQPPKKQRPVVSAPGSNPPASSRRSASRSPERAHAPSAQPAPMHKASSSFWGPHHSAERAFRRSASLPATQTKQQISPQGHFSATVPRLAASAAALKSPLDDAQVMSVQSPIEGADAPTSPPSPPSARALFQSIEVDSATRATPHSAASFAAAAAPEHQQQQKSDSARRSPSSNSLTLQQVCDAALERATRAEKQCNVLTLAMEQLLVEHVAEKEAWRVRMATLELQLSKVTQWIRSIDAESNLSLSETQAFPSAVPQASQVPTASAGAELVNAVGGSHQVELTKPPLPVRAVPSKTVVWEEVEDEGTEIGSHHGSSCVSAGRSAEVSPLPGAPGATPTPARRDSIDGESRGTSTCQVRLPPSPPMILHLHAQQ